MKLCRTLGTPFLGTCFVLPVTCCAVRFIFPKNLPFRLFTRRDFRVSRPTGRVWNLRQDIGHQTGRNTLTAYFSYATAIQGHTSTAGPRLNHIKYTSMCMQIARSTRGRRAFQCDMLSFSPLKHELSTRIRRSQKTVGLIPKYPVITRVPSSRVQSSIIRRTLLQPFAELRARMFFFFFNEFCVGSFP
jgi:hypothetical protein